MSPALGIPLVILALLIGIPVAVLVVIYLVVPLFKFLAIAVKHIARFIFGEITDVLRLVGSIVTGVLMIPLVIVNVIIGRWSAASHYGRGLSGEFKSVGLSVYRIAIGHPARLLGLTALTEGVEKRLPEVVAQAPGADRPAKRIGQFDGYRIVGSLPGGGSGSKLYVAEPDAAKLASFARGGRGNVRQVVVKSFSLKDGSSLPQIVRESRSLDAAKKLGLVLDHELTAERFFYVMEFVPGQSLSLLSQQMHASSGADGLDNAALANALKYIADLLKTLNTYHQGGLWHKDVKPDNIIVGDGRAHLVDFGLVTPLRSAMTLTTHGTEYFRDPEMVRLALKGVKVHEVDGARFDIFAAGAVLYSVIENSFPAHGVLSQIGKRCPETVRWVVRRAMTEYDKRYRTSAEMLADIDFVRFANDPFAVKPFELPSMRGATEDIGESIGHDRPAPAQAEVAAVCAAATPRPRQQDFGAAPAPRAGRSAPRLKVVNWWTGSYVRDDGTSAGASAGPVAFAMAAGTVPPRAAPYLAGLAEKRQEARANFDGTRRTAQEQLARARARVQAARERTVSKLARRGVRKDKPFAPGVNLGVGAAAVFLVLGVVGAVFVSSQRRQARPFPTAMVPSVPEPVAVDLGNGMYIATFNPTFAPTAPEAPQAPEAPRVKPGVKSVIEVGKPAPAVTSDGRVLVIVDLPKPLSEHHEATLTAAVGRLTGAGFSVLGDYPGNSAGEDELKRQIDISAQAIASCGQIGPDNPEAQRLLGEWMARGGGADLTLWVRRRSGLSMDASRAPDAPIEFILVGAGSNGDHGGKGQQRVSVGARALSAE